MEPSTHNAAVVRQGSTYGYAKLVNAANVLLNGEEKIKRALRDGLQITDAFVALGVYEEVAPVFRDGKALANELKDLDEVEARAVYEEVARLRGMDLDGVEKAVLGSMDLLSDAYDFVKYTTRRAKALAAKAKALYEEVF